MFYLGIAINGDFIEFLLIDERGNIQGVQNERHVDLVYDGSYSFRGVLESGIARVCLKANIRFNEIGYTYLAIPGYGENADYDSLLNDVLIQIFKKNNYICENDVEAALVAALANQSGITLLAGVGTVAMGKNHKNEMVRTGGWGRVSGDEAGEYWFARKILEIFTKESDGRYDGKILYNIFKERVALDHDFELINFSFEHIELFGLNFNEFVEILFLAAEEGDEFAVKVIDEGAEEFSQMAHAIIRQIHFDSPIKISYIGKLLSERYGIVPLIEKKLKDRVDVELVFQAPQLSLVTGSALKALMFRKKVTYLEIYQLLNEEYRLHCQRR